MSFFVGRCVIFSPFIRLNDCYSLAKLLEHFVIWQSRGAVGQSRGHIGKIGKTSKTRFRKKNAA